MQESDANTRPVPIYLTFDDGPHPDHTPRILDQLAELNAKATFFILGKHAKCYPDIVRRTLSEGHSIGTHSWSHWSARTTPTTTWIEDVHRARSEVEHITGLHCCLFRPPYGELTPLSLLALLRSGVRTIQWSQDTKDFEADTAYQFNQWFVNNKPSLGSVVLMHDNQALTSENLQEGCLNWKLGVDFRAIPMTIASPSKELEHSKTTRAQRHD